jgi:cysteine-rich repeat protein
MSSSFVVLACLELAACPSEGPDADEVGETATSTGDSTGDSSSSTDTSSSDDSTTASTSDTSSSDDSTTASSSDDSTTASSSDTSSSDTDSSSSEGVEPGCGDGMLDPGEACDDGNLDEDDGCSSTCELESRLVFITSTLHDGDLGGLAGADAICNMRAAAADLPGTYMAWLSTDQGSPSTRFVTSTVPWVRLDGTTIADDWADLVDGTLDAIVNQTEVGGAPPNSTYICNGTARQTWTGTAVDGTPTANTCGNFGSTAGNGAIGRNTATDANWSVCNPSVACTTMAPLYCFQQ